jgi:YD repeat-containing protein
LLSVREVGPDGTALPPYEISYQGEGMAWPSRLSYAQDHWGYYNGANGNTTMIPPLFWVDANGQPHMDGGDDRLPNFYYAQIGAIQQLKYPTGGITEFEFENNEVTDPGLQPQAISRFTHIEGDHNGGQQTLYTDTFVVNEPSNYYNANNPEGGAYVNLSYSDIGCDFPNGEATTCAILTVEGVSPGSRMIGPLTSSPLNGIYLPNGTYVLKASFNQQPPGYADFYYSIDWPTADTSRGNLVGGIRIKRITDYDGINPLNKVVKKITYTSDQTGASSGQVCGIPNNYSSSYYDDFYSSQTTLFGCEHDILHRDFIKRTATSNYPLVNIQGGYVGYTQVNVFYGDNGENGKSVYRYQYFPDVIGDFPATITSKEWMRGLLLSQSDYKNVAGNYSLLKQDTVIYGPLNNYDTSLQKITFGLKPYFNHSLSFAYGCSSDAWWQQDQDAAAIPAVQEYWTVTGNSMPEYKKSTLFNEGGNVTTEEKFTYNGRNYLPFESKALDSKSDTLITRYKYVSDYALAGSNPGWLYQMSSRSISSEPVEKIIIRKPVNGQEEVIDATISLYRQDQPLLSKLYRLEITDPVPYSAFTASYIDASGNFIMDSHYKEAISINSYDQNNNVLNQQKTNDFQSSYIWDYNNSRPIAEIKNADISSVAYTSFEADGSGNWVVGSGSVNSGVGVTGHKFFSLSGSISRSALNPATTYIVSYWTQGFALNVNNTTAQKGKTALINGASWTLYLHKVTGQSTITVSGLGTIDELRLYPITAQMTTYTYDPLIGMTSQTDAANRVTYFEYDGLARLKRIRDQDYNILKSIEYQYQAPAAWSNAEQDSLFTRDNCSLGSVPSSVLYSIPAGTVFSAISVDDANTRARILLRQKGLGHADSLGTCTWYNTPQIGTFTRDNCTQGGIPSSVSYTLPAGVVGSTISVDDANVQAQPLLAARGQAHADSICTCTWYNILVADNFTRNNCGSGYIPGPAVPVTIPANTFSSIISPQDANQQARNAAQDQANTAGTCIPLIDIVINNYINAQDVTIDFINTSTGQDYPFTPPGNGLAGSIPAGTYNVIITSASSHFMGFLCGYSSGGTSINIYNVDITTCSTLYIDNQDDTQ